MGMLKMFSLLFILASMPLCTFSGHTGIFKLGAVTSADGPYTDWQEAAKGYELWVNQFESKYKDGMRITDLSGYSLHLQLSLTTKDDNSSATSHAAAVQSLLEGGADAILCAQPVFATSESEQVDKAGRISIHGATTATEVFKRNFHSVFGVARPSSRNTEELLKSYKSSNVRRIGVMYREDIIELDSACNAALTGMKAELLQASITIKFNANMSRDMEGLVSQLSASSAEALIACTLSSETLEIIRLVDKMKKPLKNMFFTNGPAHAAVLEKVKPAEIAWYLTTPVAWHPDLNLRDDWWGSAKDYSSKYNAAYNSQPTHIAAGASAAGYVLQTALQRAFARCNISAAEGDMDKLLYTDDVISCADNQNNGRQRVIDTLATLQLDTFYGEVMFDRYRQNYGGKMRILQAFEVNKDNKRVVLPSVVLPLSEAITPLMLPGPNRYAPVCEPGTYRGPDDFLPCIICPAGEFQEFPARKNCEYCPKDYYANSTRSAFCTQCPANSETFMRGSTMKEECFCRTNFYSPTGLSGEACVPCPIHATCAGGIDPPRTDPGWYAELDRPFKMFNCNPNWVCKGNYTCKTGYTGRMCATCAPGFYMAFNRCLPCQSPASNMAQMIVLYVAFIFLNVVVSRGLETFHVIMNYCQLLSVLSMFNVNWPQAVENVLQIVNILSFEADIVQPQCLDDTWRYEQNLYIQLAFPAAIFALVVVWTLATYGMFRLKLKIQGKSLEDFAVVSFGSSMSLASVGSISLRGGGGGSRRMLSSGLSTSFQDAETSWWWLLLQAMFHIPSDPQEMAEVLLDRISIPLMTLNISYLAVLKYCLQAFYCHDFMGRKALYYSPKDLCYTPKHYRLMMVATAGLLMYIFTMWVMFFMVMRLLRRRRSFGDKRPLLLFGWLYERYTAQCHWYELIGLLQRTVFVVVGVFLVEDPVLEVIICLAVTIASTLMDVKTNALIDENSHMLQGMCDACLCTVLILGLVFYNDTVLQRTEDLSYYLAMVVILGSLAVLGFYIMAEVAFNALILVLQARHKKVAKKWGHNIKGHKHMYHVFKPWFMAKWLSKANAGDWVDWHRLCIYLKEYVHPTSETSYLSVKKVGIFWRYLVMEFPEVLDYLASVDEEERDHFAHFAEVMYQQFFETKDDLKCQLNHIVNDKYMAGVGQWLAAADDKELTFMRKLITNAYQKAEGEAAEQECSRAFSRSKSQNALMRPGSYSSLNSVHADKLVNGGSGTYTTSTTLDLANILTELRGGSPPRGGSGSFNGGSSGSLSTPAATITIPSHSPGHKYGHGGRNFALELKRKQSNSLPQVPTALGAMNEGGHYVDGNAIVATPRAHSVATFTSPFAAQANATPFRGSGAVPSVSMDGTTNQSSRVLAATSSLLQGSRKGRKGPRMHVRIGGEVVEGEEASASKALLDPADSPKQAFTVPASPYPHPVGGPGLASLLAGPRATHGTQSSPQLGAGEDVAWPQLSPRLPTMKEEEDPDLEHLAPPSPLNAQLETGDTLNMTNTIMPSDFATGFSPLITTNDFGGPPGRLSRSMSRSIMGSSTDSIYTMGLPPSMPTPPNVPTTTPPEENLSTVDSLLSPDALATLAPPTLALGVSSLLDSYPHQISLTVPSSPSGRQTEGVSSARPSHSAQNPMRASFTGGVVGGVSLSPRPRTPVQASTPTSTAGSPRLGTPIRAFGTPADGISLQPAGASTRTPLRKSGTNEVPTHKPGTPLRLSPMASGAGSPFPGSKPGTPIGNSGSKPSSPVSHVRGGVGAGADSPTPGRGSSNVRSVVEAGEIQLATPAPPQISSKEQAQMEDAVLAEAEALSASAKGEVRVTEDEMAEFDVKQN